MRVERVSYTKGGILQDVRLVGQGRESRENHFTVINGVNGTGKSLVLRVISDAALGLKESRQYGAFVSDIGISASGEFARVIALSGTHNDRFPITAGIELRSKLSRFDIMPFYYYGTKQSGNYTSVHKASNAISHSFLSELREYAPRRHSVERLMDYLGFTPEVEVTLRPGSRSRSIDPRKYLSEIQQSLSKMGVSEVPMSKIRPDIGDSIDLAYNILSSEYYRKEMKHLSRGPDFVLHLGDGSYGFRYLNGELSYAFPQVFWDRPQILADLISLGLFSTKIALKRKRSGQTVQLEDISSGEWHLLYSLLNLAIMVVDESLVLIDEPENSLHPQWQSDYVSLVRDLISHRKGCHVILATHSPLISASVLPEDGDLVRFERSYDDQYLMAKLEDTAYGWSPDDVLKERFDMGSVRPPELTDATNAALRSLKKSSDQTPELVAAAKEIEKFVKLLPIHDPLQPVLRAIVEIATEPTSDDDGVIG